MKIATWNVNGIRARHEQVLEWVGREKPDVLCLQEIKARTDQVLLLVCNLEGYRCHWHCAGPCSGVALNVRADAFPAEPVFSHPPFDHETRIVEANLGNLVVASPSIPAPVFHGPGSRDPPFIRPGLSSRTSVRSFPVACATCHRSRRTWGCP